jgi:hypothetical protein
VVSLEGQERCVTDLNTHVPQIPTLISLGVELGQHGRGSRSVMNLDPRWLKKVALWLL